MTILILDIEPNKKFSTVRLRIPASDLIAPSVSVVTVTYGSETRRFRRQPDSAVVADFPALAVPARMTIDFGGVLPAGVLIVPEQTVGIPSPIPPLVDDRTGQLSCLCRIWSIEQPPIAFRSMVSSLFAHNTHIASLDRTFAGCTALESVPEPLFFPLIYAKSFIETFADTGLKKLTRELFTANVKAEDFSGCFAGCRFLTEIPDDLLASCRQAHVFDRMFAGSAVGAVPPRLFRTTRPRGSFVRTFAAAPIASVPAGLMRELDPRDVDGMFEPERRLDHDPMNLKAAPTFAPDFFADTVAAAGVPTKAHRCG